MGCKPIRINTETISCCTATAVVQERDVTICNASINTGIHRRVLDIRKGFDCFVLGELDKKLNKTEENVEKAVILIEIL